MTVEQLMKVGSTKLNITLKLKIITFILKNKIQK